MQTNKIDYQTRDCTIAVIFHSERNTTTIFHSSLNSFYLIPETTQEQIRRGSGDLKLIQVLCHSEQSS